jgi:hypothetical protein
MTEERKHEKWRAQFRISETLDNLDYNSERFDLLLLLIDQCMSLDKRCQSAHGRKGKDAQVWGCGDDQE